MNGRIYDALLGRFLSADVVVQNPADLQAFNRYSYVRNSPLTYTDPTGFYLQFQEQAQMNLRQHAYAIGVGQVYDNERTKAAVATTVGMAVTVGTAGLAPECLGATTAGRVLIAEVSGSAGSAASNMADNAMNGRPILENNSIALTLGALGGIALQCLDEAVSAAMRSSAASTVTTVAADSASTPTPATAPVETAAPASAPVEPNPLVAPTAEAGTLTSAASTRNGAGLTTGQHAKVLRSNLEKVGRPALENEDAAHIVASGDPRHEEARAILDRAGIGIDDAINGGGLPSNTKVPNPLGKTTHNQTHTNRAMNKVTSELRQAEADGTVHETLKDIEKRRQTGKF